MEDYTKCELSGGVPPRVLTLMFFLLQRLGNIAQENPTADVLVEDQLRLW